VTVVTVGAAIEAALRATVRGEVDFSTTARSLYATDASNYRHVPLGVVLPLDADDVVAAVAACRAHGVSLTVRGGGTSVVGNATGAGVVLDTSKHLRRVLALDPDAGTATVEPGTVLDDLNAAAAVHGLGFAPDPSTHSRCTIGGMIGNDACGPHSVQWGRTSDNVIGLDVLLYDGTRLTVGATSRDELATLAARTDGTGRVYRAMRELATGNLELLRTGLPALPRRVSGYALDHLLPENGTNLARALVGTEGSCVTVLSATVRLVPLARHRVLVVAGFADDVSAAEAVPVVLPWRPSAVEGLDKELVDTYVAAKPDGSAVAEQLPPGGGWLFVELTGDTAEEIHEAAALLVAALAGATGFTTAGVVKDSAGQRALWRIREEGAGLATRLPDGTEAFPGWEDAAVPPENLGRYLRDFRALLGRYGLRGVTYGHFGDGCVHTRIDFDLLSDPGRAVFHSFLEDAADLVVSHGGSLSGEHGDGQARSELLARMYPPEILRLFEAFKDAWDPDGLMNPGMVVRPRPLDADMRVPERAAARVTDVVFGYPHDDGDFAKAVRRCVGVGKCRSSSGGVMCPSYRATGEEQHSTRGRAHLLLEMLEGDVVTAGWRSREVRDALDLCLSCKACSVDCPVDVDMATYKSEFLSHHYARRLRPAAHYSMGYLPVWARLASKAPRLVNAVTQSRAAPLLKRAGGVAGERSIPLFAEQTLTAWLAGRPGLDQQRVTRRLLLWPDTFTNHLSPQVGRAAVRVLESAGLGIDQPQGAVCCGLTWISTGQLAVARRVLTRTLRTMARHADDDAWVVGVEPSCTAALRKDLPELFPDDRTARWLSTHVLTFAEALDRFAPEGWAPQVGGSSISQTHCHQHAVLGTAADERLIARIGLDNSTIPSGCCGLAGNFGFERGHYEVSTAVGELVTLPAVRAAAAGTAVLADGFSCRTQVQQSTGRQAQHLAELIDRALHSEGRQPG
jgi:FAD/FMN-containing dehydrogenase/Fe-S oxidoreductase